MAKKKNELNIWGFADENRLFWDPDYFKTKQAAVKFLLKRSNITVEGVTYKLTELPSYNNNVFRYLETIKEKNKLVDVKVYRIFKTRLN